MVRRCGMADRQRVVIVGAGFGGLQAARQLAGKNVDVTLVDRQNYHLFQPLLYQVATASLEQEAIAYPVRAIVRRWKNVTFRLASVQDIDLDRCVVKADTGEIPYDYLILAAGAVTTFFGLKSVERHAYDLKHLPDATALRSHILRMFERAAQETDPDMRRALLTFVIVGGGPTGIEFAGALAELVRLVFPRDYPGLTPADARIILVEMKRVLPAYPERLQAYAIRRLKQIGVEVVLGKAVEKAEPGVVHLNDGSRIAAHTLHWAAGVQAAPLAGVLPGEKARGDRIIVNPELSPPDHPEVFVIGDMSYIEQDGQPLPAMAPVAMQEGIFAGRAILARAAGKPVEPFHYTDKGTMAVIGRGAAVARIFGIGFQGLPAWLVWLGLHLATLIGFRNRLWVLGNWAYDYVFFDRKVRLIGGGLQYLVGSQSGAATTGSACDYAGILSAL